MLVLTRTLDGAEASQAEAEHRRPFAAGTVTGAVAPGDGQVVAAGMAGRRLVTMSITSQGRARRTWVPGFDSYAHITVDAPRGRLLVVESRAEEIRTTALTVAGRQRWEHRLRHPPSGSDVTAGALDPRRGRFTFVRARVFVSEPFQLKS